MRVLLALLLLIPSLSWGLELLCKINKTFLYFDGDFYNPKEFNLYTDQPNESDIFVKINNESNYFTYRWSDRKEYNDLKFNIKIFKIMYKLYSKLDHTTWSTNSYAGRTFIHGLFLLASFFSASFPKADKNFNGVSACTKILAQL